MAGFAAKTLAHEDETARPGIGILDQQPVAEHGVELGDDGPTRGGRQGDQRQGGNDGRHPNPGRDVAGQSGGVAVHDPQAGKALPQQLHHALGTLQHQQAVRMNAPAQKLLRHRAGARAQFHHQLGQTVRPDGRGKRHAGGHTAGQGRSAGTDLPHGAGRTGPFADENKGGKEFVAGRAQDAQSVLPHTRIACETASPEGSSVG